MAQPLFMWYDFHFYSAFALSLSLVLSVLLREKISGIYLHFRRCKVAITEWLKEGFYNIFRWKYMILHAPGLKNWHTHTHIHTIANVCRWRGAKVKTHCVVAFFSSSVAALASLFIFDFHEIEKRKTHSSAQLWWLFNRVSHLAYSFSIKLLCCFFLW